ncbi:sortase domain-bontaining protein [Kitasatospora sp. NPDC048365]|uniref:sortase domain-containing protein n=1 Tax=Kitasatospora sp. NPDC048365 TaxID=3364050 RepID=UPI00371E8ECA
MTVTDLPPVASAPAPSPWAPPPAGGARRVVLPRVAPVRQFRQVLPDVPQLIGAGLAIAAALLLGLVLELGPLGAVKHLRDHETGYAQLRESLAKGLTPIGQYGADGKPVEVGTPVALLEIPQLGLREVVREGTGGGVLESGPGHRRDTPMPGQAGTSVVFGRQAGFGGPFGALGNLRPGETFKVTTGQGEQVFRVIGTRRVGDPIPAPAKAEAGRLVLVTGSGPHYAPSGTLLVDADLMSEVRPANARPLTAAALPAAEAAMGTEDAAWIPLVLWGEGLLLAAVGLAVAWARWGRRQTWIVGVPVVGYLALAVADEVARLLPNLI